jgi:hypothetical protein
MDGIITYSKGRREAFFIHPWMASSECALKNKEE